MRDDQRHGVALVFGQRRRDVDGVFERGVGDGLAVALRRIDKAEGGLVAGGIATAIARRLDRRGVQAALHEGEHQRAAKAVPEMIIDRPRQTAPAQLVGAGRVQRDDDMVRGLRPGPIDKHAVLSLQQPILDLADDFRARIQQDDIAGRAADVESARRRSPD